MAALDAAVQTVAAWAIHRQNLIPMMTLPLSCRGCPSAVLTQVKVQSVADPADSQVGLADTMNAWFVQGKPQFTGQALFLGPSNPRGAQVGLFLEKTKSLC